MESAIGGGRFIALEGPDGAGKSSAAQGLAAFLLAAGHSVLQTREPGGTPFGEQVRGILLDTASVARAPETEAFLFNAARTQLVREVIRPALERGELVVCDRFGDSPLAYQGYGSGVDLGMLRDMESWATGGLRPDLVVLLDLPVEVGLARRGRDGRGPLRPILVASSWARPNGWRAPSRPTSATTRRCLCPWRSQHIAAPIKKGAAVPRRRPRAHLGTRFFGRGGR